MEREIICESVQNDGLANAVCDYLLLAFTVAAFAFTFAAIIDALLDIHISGTRHITITFTPVIIISEK